MAEQVFILPHPAPERRPEKGSHRCPWPSASNRHMRKFVECGGRWLAHPGTTPSQGMLRVWCEYEAPTTATRMNCTEAEYPAWLHQIDLIELASIASSGRSRQYLNTDPWIWDPGFVWSVCKHFTNTGNFRADIASIEAGDIVLFGSYLKGRGKWVLDTVFVAGGPPIPRDVAHPRNLSLSSAYQQCVSEPLDVLAFPLRTVFGMAHGAEPSQALFSFVPAAPSTEEGKAFPRLDISALVGSVRLRDGRPAKYNNSQALASGTFPGGNVRLWNTLVDRTLEAGLVLGVSFDHPFMTSTRTAPREYRLAGRERVDEPQPQGIR